MCQAAGFEPHPRPLIVGELQRDDAAFLASQPLAEPACIDADAPVCDGEQRVAEVGVCIVRKLPAGFVVV